MNETVRQFRDFFVSLKLTVVLLVFGILLIFAATIDQVNLGVWAVQEKYFRTFFVMWRVGGVPIPLFPGGYFIGGLLLVNLISAHIYRFKWAWRRAGIFLTHVGLILLLIGELLTGLWQEEYAMRLTENEPKNFSESYHDNELALVDISQPDHDEVVAIPESILAHGETVQHAKLPFRVVTRSYYPNASLRMRAPDHPGHPQIDSPSPATAGAGQQVIATPLPITYAPEERNMPAALVELVGPEDSLGTWLVSTGLSAPQRVEYGGRTWLLSLRFARAYKPFTLTLLQFRHDRYAGTEIPKNFSSRIRLQTPDGREDREVLIYMNNPLRHAGLTFYQASFEPGNDKVTILQVVRNPSWLIPYVACSLMTLGLLVQFGIHLSGFVKRRRLPEARPA